MHSHFEILVTNFIANPVWLLPKFEHMGCHFNRFYPSEINLYRCILINFAFLVLRGKSQMSHEGSGELRTTDRDMPLKHLGEVLIMLWLFRSLVCQIHPPESSLWQKQYSSWKVPFYFHFTYGMAKALRQINTKSVQLICCNWNSWPLKDGGKPGNFQVWLLVFKAVKARENMLNCHELSLQYGHFFTADTKYSLWCTYMNTCDFQ